MDEDEQYTERDLIHARREGWVERAVSHDGRAVEDAKRLAALRFPLPRRFRPRRVKVGETSFSYENGVLLCVRNNTYAGRVTIPLEVLQDIANNPIEEVEDE